MKILLLVFAFGLTVLFLAIGVMLAFFPYLWFKGYLEMEKVRQQNRRELVGEEFIKRNKASLKFPRLYAISEQVLIFIVTWLPFLTIEILWVRYEWRFTMGVIYPKILDLILG